jgi:hypothetical protein
MSKQFRQAVTDLLLAKGQPVDLETNWFWGFCGDYEMNEHGQKCVWLNTQQSEVKEIVFDEFDGTDRQSRQSTALVLTHVKCVCGKYTDISIGRQGSTGELLSELLGAIERTYK